MPSPETKLQEQVEESMKLTKKMLDKQDGLEERLKKVENGEADPEGKSASELKAEISQMSDDNAEALEEMKKFQKEIQERQDEFETKMSGGQPGEGGGQSELKTSIETSMDEAGLTPDTKAGADFEYDRGNFERGGSRKAVTDAPDSAGTLLTPEYDQQLITLGREQFRVRSLLNARSTTSTTIVYFRHKKTTGTAATQENQLDLKAEVEPSFEQVTANVGTIAAYTFVARQMLDDVSYLRGVIDGELRVLVELEEDRQLMKGDGSNGDMVGLKEVATAYDPTLAARASVDFSDIQNLDVLRLALLQVSLTHFPPTGMILHPTDGAGLELIKDGDKGYLFANPMNGNALRPWGFPAAQTTQQTQGEFDVGAFNLADYWQRESVRIEISTEDGDNFRRNKATVLGEKRGTLAIKRPETIVDGKFETAKANPNA